MNFQYEASLHTINNGTEIELRLPPNVAEGEHTPMMRFLAAVLMRAEEDLGWWEEQVAWCDSEVRDIKADLNREKIRLVSPDPRMNIMDSITEIAKTKAVGNKDRYVGFTLGPDDYDALKALTKNAPVSVAALVRHAVLTFLEDPAAHPIKLTPYVPKGSGVTFTD